MTKTEIALLRWGQLPMLAAIGGWILGFVGVAAGLWRPSGTGSSISSPLWP